MAFTASALVLAVALTSNVAGPVIPAEAPAAVTVSLDATPFAAPSLSESAQVLGRSATPPSWLVDRGVSRPKALPTMYATLGLLQALDIYSTRNAIDAGGRELNPAMRKASGNSGAMLAVKALSTAGSIYFAERAWKKNRKGAVVLMAVINGVTAAVVANNVRGSR
jgi:hypothetical protein